MLDILALTGGGRGEPLHDVTPHILGSIFWATVVLYLYLDTRARRQNPERFLLVCFVTLCLAEIAALTSSLFTAFEFANSMSTSTLLAGVENSLFNIGRLLLCAALLRFIIRKSTLASSVIRIISVVFIAALIYDLLSIIFLFTAQNQLESSARLTMVAELPVVILMIFCFYCIDFNKRRIGFAMTIALACLVTESLLRNHVDVIDASVADILMPIAGNLRLWSIPIVACIALSVQHTQRNRLQNGIENAERLESLGQLSSGLAHDFNNHLQIILGYTEIARGADNLHQSMRMPLNRIEEAATSAGDLVKQLLAFSRAQPPNFQSVDLNEVIKRLEPMLCRLVTADTTVRCELDPMLRPIHADIPMLEQIIFNLVLNAKDAIDERGTIILQTRSLSADDNVSNAGNTSIERSQLIVSDNGVGMDEYLTNRMFEPFFTTKDIGKGSGLGLSTVRSIVKKHEGAVFVKSEPGQYTRVYVDFPLSEKSNVAVISDAIAGQINKPATETILLAEDEPTIREMAATLLESAGYNVLVARDGQHAVKIMRTYKRPIDLCVLDVTMPTLGGYQAYDRIIASHPDTPVLFITGNNTKGLHIRSHLPHLQKPFTQVMLVEQIRNVLRASQYTYG